MKVNPLQSMFTNFGKKRKKQNKDECKEDFKQVLENAEDGHT